MTLCYVPPSCLTWVREKRDQRHWQVLLSCAILLVVGLLFREGFGPTGGVLGALNYYSHLGGRMQCALCGGTRAWFACSRGCFVQAWAYNPFAVLLWGWSLGQVALRAWLLWRPGGVGWSARWRRLDTGVAALDDWGMRAVLPLLFGCWIARMIALGEWPWHGAA